MKFLPKIKGVMMLDKVRNTAIRISLNIELLLLWIERPQLDGLIMQAEYLRNAYQAISYSEWMEKGQASEIAWLYQDLGRKRFWISIGVQIINAKGWG